MVMCWKGEILDNGDIYLNQSPLVIYSYPLREFLSLQPVKTLLKVVFWLSCVVKINAEKSTYK